jgi:hypothetical protein
MLITRQIAAEQLGAYLRHQLSLAQLVDWSEQQMMDGEFETPAVRDLVARLGIADVHAFGLTWEDCQTMLHDLGFEAHVDIVAA